MEAEVGLIDYLLEPELELPDILFETNLNGIVVIPSGRRHAQATELLASRRMQSLVSKVSQEFGNYVVIFDTPPLLLTNEAQVLAKIAGQIVLVIESRVSSQESVVRAFGLLDRSKPINAIFNKSRGAASNMYSGGNYAYPYWNHSNGRKAN
jgi:Mrp family chromosome partitioning ATPase